MNTKSNNNQGGTGFGSSKQKNVQSHQSQTQVKKAQQLDLTKLDPEKQKCFQVLQKLQNGMTLLQQQNDELSSKITEQVDTNKQCQEEHKQQLLHIETLNMMTKYQLVYVKLETTMHKILTNIGVRKRLRLKKAFLAFRNNATSFKIQNERQVNKKRLVITKFELNLQKFTNAVQRYSERVQVSHAMRQLKLNYTQKLQEEKIRQKNLKKINEIQQDLVQTIKKCETLGSKQEEIDNEIIQTKKKMQDQQKYIKDLEERDVHLNSEYIQLLEKQNNGTQERVNVKDLEEKVYVLEGQISEIESENKHLKDKLDSTNGSVGSFIKDMNCLLDSHELQNILNMEVESEEDEEIDRMLDVEYDEQRPHAGTGGSSKMRSRPNQAQNQGIAGRAQMIQNNQILQQQQQQITQQQQLQQQQQQQQQVQQQQQQQQVTQKKQQQNSQSISNRMMAQLINGQSKQQQSKTTTNNYHSNRQNR